MLSNKSTTFASSVPMRVFLSSNLQCLLLGGLVTTPQECQYMVVVLPDPFRRMGVWRDSTETSQGMRKVWTRD